MGGSKAAMASNVCRGTNRGGDHDVAAQAVPDGHHGTAALRAHLGHDREQILHVAPEVHDPAVPGALVTPPVVGQRAELG